MPGGRPTDYSQEITEKICMLIRSGGTLSLNKICESEDMPHKDTVITWLDKYPEFSDQYAKAKAIQADGLLDEMFDVVEDEESAQMITAKVNAIAIIQARLAPKKYGTQKIGLGQDQDAAALRIEVCYVETNTAEAE